MPVRNRRGYRRGIQSRLRHNRRRRELYRSLIARQAALTVEEPLDLTLRRAEEEAVIDLTLESPAPIVDLTGDEDIPVVVDLTVADTPESAPGFASRAPLGLLFSPGPSYSPVPSESFRSPVRNNLIPRRLSFPDTPDYFVEYPSLRSPPISEPSTLLLSGSGSNLPSPIASPSLLPEQELWNDDDDDDNEWEPPTLRQLFPVYFPDFDLDNFPGQPNVPPGEPVPEEYFTLLFRSFYLREQ